MTPRSKLSAKAHQARGLVESTLRQARTRSHGQGPGPGAGPGRTAGPHGGRTRASTMADVRRIAMRARGAFRK